MRELTGSARIRIRAPRPELTGDTRIRLSQVKGLKEWIEDRRYEIGEISETTGLQKIGPNQWREPSGATSGAIGDKDREYKLNYAIRTYLTYKNRRSKSDVPKIAKATRMTPEDIKAVRFHIFEDNNIKFDDGTKHGFSPSWRIADAWQRMERGRPKETDIILLKHELEELTLMKNYGYSYQRAHLTANLKYPWELKIKGKWRNENDDKLQEISRDRLDYYLRNGSDIGWSYSDKQKDKGN